jgi:hypothetical protein
VATFWRVVNQHLATATGVESAPISAT